MYVANAVLDSEIKWYYTLGEKDKRLNKSGKTSLSFGEGDKGMPSVEMYW